MPSNIFQREVGQLLNGRFRVAHRIDDAAYNRFGGRQVSQKPYDFFGVLSSDKYLGIHFGAEVKMTKGLRLPTSNLSSHQRFALHQLLDVGAKAWLFINWRHKRYGRAGVAVWIDFYNYYQLERFIERKSVKPDDFAEEYFLERVAGGWSVPKTHILCHIK